MDYADLLDKLDEVCGPFLTYSTRVGDGVYVEIYNDSDEVIAQGDVYTEEDFQRLTEDI